MQSWRNENKEPNSQQPKHNSKPVKKASILRNNSVSRPRQSTKYFTPTQYEPQAYRNNSKVKGPAGGFLDNAGRGSSVMRRMSQMPTPSQGVRTMKCVSGNEGFSENEGFSDKEKSGENKFKQKKQHTGQISEDKFEKVAVELEKQFPSPSARYSPDYDELSEEREIADNGSFGSAPSSAFNEEFMEHPLPHERSQMAPVYRVMYFILCVAFSMTLALLQIRNISEKGVGDGFFATQLLMLIYYRYMYTYVIAAFQIFIDRSVCKK